MTKHVVGRYEVALCEITVGGRKRVLQADAVERLAVSMQREGLHHPVTLNTDAHLLAGRHRLAAAEKLGWTAIAAEIVDADALHAELTEIDENLCRADLSFQEQSEHLKRRREILAELGLMARLGDNQFSTGGASDAPPLVTVQDLAREAGLSERSAQQRLQIASMPQAVRDLTRPTEVAESLHDLVALAVLPAEEQMAVARAIHDGAKTVAEAQHILHPEPVEKAPEHAAADIPERLGTVELQVRASFPVRSDRTRVRGDKVYRRESEDAVHIITMEFPAEVREGGDYEGLRRALQDLAGKTYHDEGLRADWVRTPPVGTREVEA